MGMNLYVPEWQNAVPVQFKSRNPLLQNIPIVLDLYEIVVEERNPMGEKIGEHSEQCVTHKSLLRFYEDHCLMYGYKVQFDPMFNKESVICRCTITKVITDEEARRLIQNGYQVPMSNYEIHWEALGEASSSNTSTEISQKHLATTAENRSFDRALIRFLALDTGEKSLYSSSDEIGKPAVATPQTETPAATAKQSWYKAAQKASAPQAEVGTVSSVPTVQTSPKPVGETPAQPVQQNAPFAQPAAVRTGYEAQRAYQPPTNQSSGKAPLTQEQFDEMVHYSETEVTEDEVNKALNWLFSVSNNECNGRPLRDVIDSAKSSNKAERDSAGKALYIFMRYRPKNAEQLSIWKVALRILNVEGLIHFRKSTGSNPYSMWIKSERI